MSIDPEDDDIWVALDLRGQRGDGGAVVAAKHGEQRVRRHPRQLIGHLRPAGLDVRSGVEVSQVVDLQPGEEPPVLGHRRHRRGEAADALGREGRALAVHGRAVVRNSSDDHVGGLWRAAGEASPRPQPIKVHRALRSGTLRMLSDPITNQTTNTLNTTTNPPGRPRIRGPALNGSRSTPPAKTAMMPAPAVAMLEKPMYSPPWCPGMMS